MFALIDSLTLQSAFSGVRLESYMFTEESFRAVRDVLKPDGVLVVYNYFREPWLVDRLANTAAAAFGEEPMVHVHPAKDQLGVIVVGPRLKTLDEVSGAAVGGHRVQPGGAAGPARAARARPVHRARHRQLAVPLHEASRTCRATTRSRWPSCCWCRSSRSSRVVRGAVRKWSWEFFFLGAGFMLLETKSIIQFALLWGSTWVVASLTIAAVLVMALVANWTVAHVEVRRPRVVGAALLALLAVNYFVPVGTLAIESRAGRVGRVQPPRLQPDLLRGAAVRIEHQAVRGRHHRLRRQPARARWWAAWPSTCRC